MVDQVLDVHDGQHEGRAVGERDEQTRELLERLSTAETGCRRRRVQQQLIGVNMCVAEAIARRYRGRGERVEDLEQAAYVGLAKAVNRFDPSLDKDFLTFAVPTISGEVKKHFRDCCWMVRPPRRIQELQGRVTACVGSLSQDLGRFPRPAEMADQLGAGLDDVVESLSADGCFTPTSLDILVDEFGATVLGDLLGRTDADLGRAELHLVLAPLIRALPARDRDILALRFYHDWTQEQIAQEFGTTQIQISRQLSKIMALLRQHLT